MNYSWKQSLKVMAICGGLLVLSACTMNQVGWAIGVVEKAQAPRFHTNRLPLRLPVVLHEKNTLRSEIFQVHEADNFYAHLVLHVYDWEKSAEHKKLYNYLDRLIQKFNYHPDSQNIYHALLLPHEEIHAKLSIQNVDTGQMVYDYPIHLKGNLKERYLAFHSYTLAETAIAFGEISFNPNTAYNERLHFHLPKGRYRLIFDNQHESTAYQPYQPRLQLAPQLPNWF